MKIIVADSGPLIALAKVQCLHLPKALWGRVIAPSAVLGESTLPLGKPDTDAIRDAVARGWIEEVADIEPDAVMMSLLLDPGETQALARAREAGGAVLIDERRGRRAAARLGLPHIGTCGLFVLAKRSGCVTAVAPMLTTLSEAGYFLAPALVTDTLRLAGESP